MSNILNIQNLKREFFIVVSLAFWTVNVGLSQEFGKLRLEGKHIERLVLRRKDGSTQKLNQPCETIKLPIGEYRLQDVRLKGGYNWSRSTSTHDWVAVTKDKPATLKVGAPLKQTVKIERQGPILVIHYELTGVGGKTYTGVSNRSKRPFFTAFKGSKEVATGQFEFG